MPSNSPILIETARVSRDNLADYLGGLQGCWKCSSLLWMQVNGLPVLPGIVLNSWTAENAAVVSRFSGERNFSELLLRIEKPFERWTRRRGGYTVALDGIQNQVKELEREGMLTILLEPASPYQDVFSLGAVSELRSDKVDVEVVGGGFDASDILKADLLPHERFEVFLGNRGPKASRHSSEIKRRHLVGQTDYIASVQRRLVKIGARLRNPSFPDEAMNGATQPEKETLAYEAMNFLRASGQTTILDQQGYKPIPQRLLDLFLDGLVRIQERVKASRLPWNTLAIASSFLPPERLVMWDFYVPGEQDTSALSRL